MRSRDIGGWFVVLLVSALLNPASAHAQSASVGVYQAGTNVAACSVNIPAGGVTPLDIKLTNALAPIKNAKFRVLPTTGTFTFLGGPSFDMTFGTCVPAGTTIASILVINNGPAVTGCSFDIVPASDEATIVLTDCDGYALTGQDATGWREPCDPIGWIIAPYRPFPENGATNVPTNIKLGFVHGAATDVAIHDTPFEPFDNDDIICAELPGYGLPLCVPPIDPGILLPNTTYFWQAAHACYSCNHGEAAFSPLFTFTTGSGPVATEHATWGAVKALYRE